MADPYLSEVKIFSFSFAPRGWALCNGQLLPINQNQALFSLLGTTYGGDGRVNFALPNLQGRVPIHVGTGHTLGQVGGEQAHTLSIPEMPAHQHPVNATTSTADQQYPSSAGYWAAGSAFAGFHQTVNSQMDPATVSQKGGSQAHSNMQPYLTLNYCIALQGIFPSPN